MTNPEQIKPRCHKLITAMPKIRDLREKIMTRESWNFFVGDEDYKTNFFLQFRSPFVANVYEKHLLASSIYSMRVILFLITIINLCLFQSEMKKRAIAAFIVAMVASIEDIPKAIP